MKKIEFKIRNLYEGFKKANKLEEKIKIKKLISQSLEEYIEETSKYTYGRCRTMKEALTIIRNCFSHIGRTTIGEERLYGMYIYLNDYDNDNERSVQVICKYDEMINILKSPYENQKQKTLKTQK